VLTPDAQTAISGGVLFAWLFEQAGLPEGLLHVLPGDSEPGAAIARHPGIGMVSFTGSTAVGRKVGASAGRTLKRVSLELGGNNALIVLDDADLDIASSAGAWGAFLHQGQVCMTAGRHIVLDSIADQYLDLLAARAVNLAVGDPFTEQVALGPLINASQLANVDRIVTETLSQGAELRAGGTHHDLFYSPTVLAGVTTSMPAFREEIFGPVAPASSSRAKTRRWRSPMTPSTVSSRPSRRTPLIGGARSPTAFGPRATTEHLRHAPHAPRARWRPARSLFR
jgi:benzaldehyde dehydrogenase (NAD)